MKKEYTQTHSMICLTQSKIKGVYVETIEKEDNLDYFIRKKVATGKQIFMKANTST